MADRETIFALATGAGVAGVAVFRLSGSQSWEAIKALTRRSLPSPRTLSRRWLWAEDSSRIDDALVVIFEAGASFTGEQSAEIQCHGSRAVIDMMLSTLGKIEGCRRADPGEFTRRAFEQGQMDLIEVEGLSDLLKAETEFQRRQAMRVMSGAVSDRISDWRHALVRARALIEVTIDWADEEVPEDVSPEVVTLLKTTLEEVRTDLVSYDRTERLREGYEVAIIGPPNAGKSSLLNAIAGRDVALISEIAGTTRDVLEVRCDLSGVPVIFLDTAGMRETTDEIERAGVDRARDRAIAADLRIHLSSPDTESTGEVWIEPQDLKVWSKADLAGGNADLEISTKDGLGVSDLLHAVEQRLLEHIGTIGSFGHVRQRRILEDLQDKLRTTLSGIRDVDPEVTAEHLRGAVMSLDSLTGRQSVEDVLGEVFSSFCLGK